MKDQQIEKAMDGIENRIRHIYNCGYQQGYEDGKKNHEKVRNDDMGYGYRRGLEDAWECARKIVLSEYHGGMPGKQFGEIFEERQGALVLKNLTVQQAMKKIKDYEERQTEELKVGDEVILSEASSWSGQKAIVIGVDKSRVPYHILTADGSTEWIEKEPPMKKTGRHFPQIAEVLEQMRKEKKQ